MLLNGEKIKLNEGIIGFILEHGKNIYRIKKNVIMKNEELKK